jgi:hypothetical protein
MGTSLPFTICLIPSNDACARLNIITLRGHLLAQFGTSTNVTSIHAQRHSDINNSHLVMLAARINLIMKK